MNAEGDALILAADTLFDGVVSPPDDPIPATEWQARYAALRDTLTAYIAATDALIADHESRISTLEP